MFKKRGKVISSEIINHILDISYLHTYYVQAIANFLYSQDKAPASISEFDFLYREFILEKSDFYRELPEMLTKQQFSVLKGIAKY